MERETYEIVITTAAGEELARNRLDELADVLAMIQAHPGWYPSVTVAKSVPASWRNPIMDATHDPTFRSAAAGGFHLTIRP